MKFSFAALLFLFAASLGTSIIFYSELKHSQRKIKTIAIDPNILQKKLASEPPAWMLKQIRSDLLHYSSGISKSMIEEAFSGKKIEEFSLVRFTIKEGHISFAHDEKQLNTRHFKELLGCMKKLNDTVPLPDVDFIVSLEDGFGGNPGLGPCFVFAKKADVDTLILIPDIKALVGYAKLRKMIPQANEKFPWEKKLAKSFWRGSTTGGYSTLTAWEHLTRAQLVLLSIAHPDAVDARFHAAVQCDPEVPLLLKAKGMMGKSVTKRGHLKFKYLVDVDGNSCSYERYFWLLLSNSLVLKQMTDNVQWYYGGLEPYKHFVPVKKDLSDLLDQIEWAKTHDMEAQLIAEEATQFVKDHLSPEDTALYLYLLLNEYSRLQK